MKTGENDEPWGFLVIAMPLPGITQVMLKWVFDGLPFQCNTTGPLNKPSMVDVESGDVWFQKEFLIYCRCVFFWFLSSTSYVFLFFFDQGYGNVVEKCWWTLVITLVMPGVMLCYTIRLIGKIISNEYPNTYQQPTILQIGSGQSWKVKMNRTWGCNYSLW